MLGRSRKPSEKRLKGILGNFIDRSISSNHKHCELDLFMNRSLPIHIHIFTWLSHPKKCSSLPKCSKIFLYCYLYQSWVWYNLPFRKSASSDVPNWIHSTARYWLKIRWCCVISCSATPELVCLKKKFFEMNNFFATHSHRWSLNPKPSHALSVILNIKTQCLNFCLIKR